jgi:hypothetical protein
MLAHLPKLTYYYAFVNNSLELTVTQMHKELEVKPVIHKEVWILQKSK